MKTKNKVYLNRSPKVVLNSLKMFDLSKLDTIKDISSFKSLILKNEKEVISKYINHISEITHPEHIQDIVKCLINQPELSIYLNQGASSSTVNNFVNKK